MNAVLRRVGSTMSPLALLVAVLALVVSAAGVGYAAGQIGSKQIKNKAITAKKIKNNAVTSPKIKKDAVTADKVQDGSLTAADLAQGEVEKKATLSNGGEGDCVWTAGATLIPGLAAPSFRKDRFGTVHLGGSGLVADGTGGDGDCDSSAPGQSSDATMFTLPAGYVPAHSLIVGGSTAGVIIVGPTTLVSGSTVLPPGSVTPISPGPGSGLVLLDGISFEPVGSSVVSPRVSAPGARSSVDLFTLLDAG